MSAASLTTGVRPPPPAYRAALRYPVTSQLTKKKPCSTCNGRAPLDSKVYCPEPIYQSLPFDTVSLYDLPGHYYTNTGRQARKHDPSHRHSYSGKIGGIILEPIPENQLEQLRMGVKTYAQLEVVAAGSQRENDLINGCSDNVQNGKAVLVTLRHGSAGNHSVGMDDTGDPQREVTEYRDPGQVETCSVDFQEEEDLFEDQTQNDLECLLQAAQTAQDFTNEGAPGSSKGCAQSCSSPKGSESTGYYSERLSHSNQTEEEEELEALLTIERKDQGCDSPTECQPNADSGFSECSRFDFADHVTDHVTDNVIYSEPEYSSSDISVKGACDNTPSTDGPKKCQRTLKRTYNGVNHTVYELSPSDSFYSSGDNIQQAEAACSSALLNSTDGLARLGHSSRSLTETPTKGRRQLSRGSRSSVDKCLTPSATASQSRDVEAAVGSPVKGTRTATRTAVATTTTPEASTAAVLDDPRTDYKRRAADRGTLYCACGGIMMVGTIVFLLIYFS